MSLCGLLESVDKQYGESVDDEQAMFSSLNRLHRKEHKKKLVDWVGSCKYLVNDDSYNSQDKIILKITEIS